MIDEQAQTIPAAERPHMPEGYLVPEGEGRLLAWEAVTERMENSLNYWIATVGPQSRPHVTPVWGVWMDDTFYFDGSPQTRRGRNIATNPAVVVHLESGDEVVILHGEAHEVQEASHDLRLALSKAYGAKYAAKGYAPGPETWAQGGLYRLTLRRALAWTSFSEDATRWRF